MSSKNDEEPRAKDLPKQGSSVDLAKVHSANSWESADLGDDERKKKFLKLMGASKKEHHGRFIIGNKEPANKHARAKTETEAVNKELEDQYKHSHEHKINRWSHKGLGFTSDEKSAEGDNSNSSEVEGAEKKDDQSEDTQGKGDNSEAVKDTEAVKDSQTEKVERKRESTESSATNSSGSKKPKMMNFVKSSDS